MVLIKIKKSFINGEERLGFSSHQGVNNKEGISVCLHPLGWGVEGSVLEETHKRRALCLTNPCTSGLQL